MRRRVLSLVVVGALAAPGSSRAQAPPAPAPAPTETAEALFARATEHKKLGAWRAACPLFAASLQQDAQLGTLLNLADCEEHAGALAQALARWREALDKLGPGGDPKYVALAKTHAEDLEARVPRLAIRLAAGAPAGTRVLRGGEELASAALGVPMAVEVGAVEVVALAPGRVERRQTVTVAERDRVEVTVEAGAEVAVPVVVAPVGPVAPAPVPAVVQEVAPVQGAAPSFWRTHRVSLGLAGGAAALVAAGGAVGEATWIHFQDVAKNHTAGASSSLRAEQWATNGLFMAAGAVGVAAVVTFVVEAKGKARSVAVVGEGAGARVVVRY